MRFIRTKAVIATVGLALSLAACGDAGDDGGEATDVEVQENAADEFEDGTAMKDFADSGEITIGVKYDQPGIGFKGATDDMPVGFDPEIGKILAASLGIAPEDVTWKETISDNREPFLQSGEVDLVLASYSITDERRAVVGQAGPYYVTGQQLLVAADSDIETLEDVAGTEVCSVTGSTSAQRIKDEYAKGVQLVERPGYAECVTALTAGQVDAVTTDDIILAGLASTDANQGKFKVVGNTFSEERYGVGLPDGSDQCEAVNEAITKMIDEGAWEEAVTANTEGADYTYNAELNPPEPEPCGE